MKTGLKKSQKTTIIEFDEQGPRITVSTHNTDLKNRLGAYAAAGRSIVRRWTTTAGAARPLRSTRAASVSD